MNTLFNREIGVVILMVYIISEDLNDELNLLASIILGLAACHMFIKYQHRNE